VLALAWLLCASQGCDKPAAQPPLVIAVGDPLAKENACACVAGQAQRNYPMLGALLSREIGRPVELVFCHSLSNALERAERPPSCYIGKTSAAWSQAATQPSGPRCLAMLTGPDGATTLQGFFIVRREDPARAVPDLAGRRILFGYPEEAEKHAAALDLLRTLGVPAPTEISLEATCTAAALAVVKGAADAAVISDYAWPLLSACGALEAGSVRVVGRTKPVPFIGVFVTGPLAADDEAGILRVLRRVSTNRAFKQAFASKAGFTFETTPPLREPSVRAWSDWRGSASRDSVAPDLPGELPPKPAILWRHPMTAQSLGGVSATSGRLMVSDKSANGEQDIWRCLDADTGRQLWSVACAAAGEMEYSRAPRATPVIDGDQVFLLGAFGDLLCVSLETGNVIWRINLIRRFGGKVPQWGFCGTPLIVDERVVVQTGHAAAGLVALDRLTGRELWRCPGSLPSYGNLIVAHLGGRRQIVGHDSRTLGGWDPETGRRLWQLAPSGKEGFHVPTPAQVGDLLLVATETDGTRLYPFNQDGTIQQQPWAVSDALAPDVSSPIVRDGFVWGNDNAGIHVLSVADKLRTVWEGSERPYNQYMSLISGPGSVLGAALSGDLFCFASGHPTGRVTRAAVFQPAGEFQPEAWSHPAVVGTRLFWRSAREVACVDLGR
jgi:outer membrane protein assembly factor BamB